MPLHLIEPVAVPSAQGAGEPLHVHGATGGVYAVGALPIHAPGQVSRDRILAANHLDVGEGLVAAPRDRFQPGRGLESTGMNPRRIQRLEDKDIKW